MGLGCSLALYYILSTETHLTLAFFYPFCAFFSKKLIFFSLQDGTVIANGEAIAHEWGVMLGSHGTN